MLGKNFVSTRSRLLEIHANIKNLAKQTLISYEEQGDVATSLEIIQRPFLFSVCGEINAGKSSLINALHGRAVCRVSDLPQTSVPHLHLAGPVRKEIPHGDQWCECHWPDEGLHHLHWLDLPGIDAFGKHADVRWRSWLEASDVILVVFAYRNPWSAATWDFLAKLPETFHRNMVFVVQSCDQAEDADLPVLLNHIRDLAQKRIGHQPPVFLVSARRALAVNHTMRAADPGMEELKSWLQQKVDLCPERWRAMESLRRAALALLYQIDDKVDGLNRAVLRDVGFLEELEREIEALLQHTIHQQAMGLGSIADEYEKQAGMMSRTLHTRLGLIRSVVRMITGEHTAQKLEILMQKRLTDAVKSATDRNAEMLIRQCESHWSTIIARVEQWPGVVIMPWTTTEIRLQTARKQLVERMEHAAMRSVGQLRVRGLLIDALRQRNAGLSMWMTLMLLSLIVAGIAGGLYLPWIPMIALCIAGFFSMGLTILAMRTAKDMVDEYRERLLRGADQFLSSLRGDYEEGLTCFFREYAQGLHGIRESLSHRESALEPYSQRWNDLFLEIKAIEQEMTF